MFDEVIDVCYIFRCFGIKYWDIVWLDETHGGERLGVEDIDIGFVLQDSIAVARTTSKLL